MMLFRVFCLASLVFPKKGWNSGGKIYLWNLRCHVADDKSSKRQVGKLMYQSKWPNLKDKFVGNSHQRRSHSLESTPSAARPYWPLSNLNTCSQQPHIFRNVGKKKVGSKVRTARGEKNKRRRKKQPMTALFGEMGVAPPPINLIAAPPHQLAKISVRKVRF